MFGEHLAAEFLRARGVSVSMRNARVGRSEIDIVGIHEGNLVAFEVKTAVRRHRGDDPIHEVTSAKLGLVRRGLRGLGTRSSRVDVVTVLLGAGGAAVRWVRDARW